MHSRRNLLKTQISHSFPLLRTYSKYLGEYDLSTQLPCSRIQLARLQRFLLPVWSVVQFPPGSTLGRQAPGAAHRRSRAPLLRGLLNPAITVHFPARDSV